MPHVKIVCPTAPIQPVTLNGGMRMTSWHDIKSLDNIDAEDYDGLPDSIDIVRHIINAEIKSGIKSDRILLGGFSQGAALSILTGFQFDQQLAGIVALSGYLAHNGDFADILHEANKSTPAFVGHGNADMVVRYEAGEKLHAALEKAGITSSFHTYNRMGHSTCPQEMRKLFQFIGERLK
jgi:predicted esterase